MTDDKPGKVLSMAAGRSKRARGRNFTMMRLDDDACVERLVWIGEGTGSVEEQRIGFESPHAAAGDTLSDGWSLTPDQARRVAVMLIAAAMRIEAGRR